MAKARTPARNTDATAQKTRTPARRGLNANPRPRKAKEDEFDLGTHSRPSGQGYKDDRTLNEKGPRVDLVRPSWNGKTGTTFRLNGCFDINIEDEDVIMHGRKGVTDWELTDWIRGYRAAKYVGIDPKITYLLYDPRAVKRNEVNPDENPYNVLLDAVRKAVKAERAMIGNKNVLTARWANLLDRNHQRCAFTNPTWLYFVQGLIFEHNGVVYVKGGSPPRGARDDDVTQIIELSKSAAEELVSGLAAGRDGFQGDTNDFDQFKYPNPVSLTDGPFVTIYNEDKHHVGLQQGDAAADEEPEEEEYDESASSGKKGGNDSFKGWKCHLDDKFLYLNQGKTKKAPVDLSRFEVLVCQRLVWWDNILFVPTIEAQCVMLAQSFRSMPSLIRYGWKDNPEFFSDDVEAALKARTTHGSAEVPSEDEGGENEEEDYVPERTETRASAALPDIEDDAGEEDYESNGEDHTSDEDEMDAAMAAAERRAERRAPVDVDDEEEEQAPPTRRKKVKRTKKVKRSEAQQSGNVANRQTVPRKKVKRVKRPPAS